MIRVIGILLGLSWTVLFPGGVTARAGGEFIISQDPSVGEQNCPSVAAVPGGRFLVAWQDFRSGSGDIYAQSFDSAGKPTGDNFLLNDDINGAYQADPCLASDWLGHFYVVWTDYRNNVYPFGPDIYYQKLDTLGRLGSNCNLTVELPDSSHQSPSVGVTGWGKGVVAWADLRNRNWDVYLQKVSDDGTRQGINVKVNDDVVGAPQHEPDIAVAPAGWSVVVWYDSRSGNDDIYLQKFDTLGRPVGSNIRVNSDDGTTRQKFPAVAVAGTGVITVVWTDWRNGVYPGNADVFGQRFDSALNRLGANFLVNLDGSQASQRDAKVAADRMGNVCVVWSDSANGDWNITAQTIDYTGRFIGTNFPVNLEKTGRQLFPDVATDGYALFLVWADNRAGNFDIYGRIIDYNTPSLRSIPDRVDVSMDRGGSNPVPTKLVIQNTGYGELKYRARASQGWIIPSDTIGLTPDSLTISIDGCALGWGSHHGRLTLIDDIHNDSTVTVPVTVTVTGPIIKISPDSLSFGALMERGAPEPGQAVITNSGSGILSWEAAATASWIRISRRNGAAGDTIEVGCDLAGLAAGEYGGYLILADSGAVNSPESLQVTLTLVTGRPYLAVQPDSLYYRLRQGEIATDTIGIANLGDSALHWQVTESIPWLKTEPMAGVDSGLIVTTITTDMLTAGRYRDSIVIFDSSAFNKAVAVPVIIDVVPTDAMIISAGQAGLGEGMQLQLYLLTHGPVQSGLLKLSYDPRLIRADSLIPALDGSQGGRLQAFCDNSAHTVGLVMVPDSADSALPAGRHYLADLFLTANDSVTGVTVLASIPDSFYLETPSGIADPVSLLSDSVWIGGSTPAANGDDNHSLEFSLEQNFPNPCNGATRIIFGLRQAGPVRVQVYNILGQKVALLLDERLPAGSHTTMWDGRDSSDRETPSGIYFCRLETPVFCAFRKMIYLK